VNSLTVESCVMYVSKVIMIYRRSILLSLFTHPCNSFPRHSILICCYSCPATYVFLITRHRSLFSLCIAVSQKNWFISLTLSQHHSSDSSYFAHVASHPVCLAALAICHAFTPTPTLKTHLFCKSFGTCCLLGLRSRIKHDFLR